MRFTGNDFQSIVDWKKLLFLKLALSEEKELPVSLLLLQTSLFAVLGVVGDGANVHCDGLSDRGLFFSQAFRLVRIFCLR